MRLLAGRLLRGQARAAVFALAVSLGFFLLWDIIGICLGIFATNPAWVGGLFLGSANLPAEEVAFLLLLGLSALVLYLAFFRDAR